jgi:acetolactate synthase-1/2/3 large subunit
MSKGSPISPSLMATKSAGATKAPERVDRTAEHAVVDADLLPPLLSLGRTTLYPQR